MYNNTYHSTTKKIPFEIFYRIGNRDLKTEDLTQGLLQFDPDNMSTDELRELEGIESSESETLETPETNNNKEETNNNILKKENLKSEKELKEIKDLSEVFENILLAAGKMVEKRTWKYDRFVFNVGERVIVSADKNDNPALRMDPLYTKLDVTVYEIIGVEGDSIEILSEDGRIKKTVDRLNLRHV